MRSKNKLIESKTKYKRLYSDIENYIQIKLKARGIHDVIISICKNDIKDKNILDIGCGLGRMSLLASRYANKVVGIDHTENAINVANTLKIATKSKNIEFICTSLEDYQPSELFDVVILSGTLEHIIECEPMVKKISSFIKKGGILISDSPSEFNFRGILHASLWKLFDFPMTLSDVNIITPDYMSSLALKNGMQIEKSVGTLYSRAWGEAGKNDLKQRMPNVLRDVADKVKKIKVDYTSYYEWLDQACSQFDKLLASWVKMKYVKKIPKRTSVFKIDEKYLLDKGLSVKLIKEYLAPDFSVDPYYSNMQPYVNLSGNIIYYLRKL